MKARSVCLALTLLSASAPAAEPATLSARLECQRAAAPGRILCQLDTRASAGRLVWSDALVVRAPEFARPLRSRFVAQLDPSGAARASARLALVAAAAGQGTLELLARAVVCRRGPGGDWCAPEVSSVTATVQVDAISSP
jgi:hypothetical protein